MMKLLHKPLTADEREKNRAQKRQRAQRAVKALRCPEGLAACFGGYGNPGRVRYKPRPGTNPKQPNHSKREARGMRGRPSTRKDHTHQWDDCWRRTRSPKSSGRRNGPRQWIANLLTFRTGRIQTSFNWTSYTNDPPDFRTIHRCRYRSLQLVIIQARSGRCHWEVLHRGNKLHYGSTRSLAVAKAAAEDAAR